MNPIAIHLIDLFYAILTSCNFLVMYVPFIIIYYAKYCLFVCFNLSKCIYSYLRTSTVLLSNIFIVLILLDILISNTFIYCYAFINSFTNIH